MEKTQGFDSKIQFRGISNNLLHRRRPLQLLWIKVMAPVRGYGLSLWASSTTIIDDNPVRIISFDYRDNGIGASRWHLPLLHRRPLQLLWIRMLLCAFEDSSTAIIDDNPVRIISFDYRDNGIGARPMALALAPQAPASAPLEQVMRALQESR